MGYVEDLSGYGIGRFGAAPGLDSNALRNPSSVSFPTKSSPGRRTFIMEHDGPATQIPDFFWIIRERPDPDLDFFAEKCPACGGAIAANGYTATCVGWCVPDGLSEHEEATHPNNPNHHTREFHCIECAYRTVLHMSGGNVWEEPDDRYPHADRVVLRGVSNCCGNNYVYTCSDCGDKVRIKLDSLGTSIRWGGDNPTRFVFECDSCDNRVVVDRAEYKPYIAPRRTEAEPEAEEREPVWAQSAGGIWMPS